MSKKKATKHKATEERTTLLFFFPKTEKHQRSQSLRKQWNVHTRGSERARETARETRREQRRPSGYQSNPDISPRDRQRPVTSRARLPIPPGYNERTASGYQLCSVSDLFGCHRGEAGRPVTGYQSQRPRETERRRTGRRAGASVVFFVELQTLVTGGWFCTGFLGERCEFLHFGGRCVIGLSLLLVSISLRSAFTDTATFCGRFFQRAQFKLFLRGFINFCNSLIHVSSVFLLIQNWFEV